MFFFFSGRKLLTMLALLYVMVMMLGVELPCWLGRVRGLAVCASHENPQSGDQWLTVAATDGTISVYCVHIAGVSAVYTLGYYLIAIFLMCKPSNTVKPVNSNSAK
jgi:hypothetical protein